MYIAIKRTQNLDIFFLQTGEILLPFPMFEQWACLRHETFLLQIIYTKS